MHSASSSFSTQSVDSSDTILTDEKKTSNKDIHESYTCPFKLQWSLGINPNVPLLNLTTENRTILSYACSHAVMLYDYETKETTPLQGHQNAVGVMSVSKEGKWLLTADFGDDSVVIVWDTESGVPVRTFFNPHGKESLTTAGISPDAKYVVIVGNEKCQKVSFWLWTYGTDIPNAFCELIEIPSERVKEIRFIDNEAEKFILITDYHILFFRWRDNELEYYIPQVVGKLRRFGIFNGSCYVTQSQEALIATTKGFVLVWGHISGAKKADEISQNLFEEKKHIKSIKLQKYSITVILSYENLVVTGNAKGCITFYDSALKILYWCQDPGLDNIRSISFELQSRLLGPIPTTQRSDRSEYDAEEGEVDYESEEEDRENFEDRKKKEKIAERRKTASTLTVNLENIVGNPNNDKVTNLHIARDATLENAPFYVRNFLVSTAAGAIALIEISKLKCHFIKQGLQAAVTSLDAHPESHYVVTGNADSLVCLYNYLERSLVVCRKVPPLPDFQPILDAQVANNNIIYVTCPDSHKDLTAVTELKYSPKCDMIACGLENGALWMLHPITLEPLEDLPYKHSRSSIENLIFTKCATYMAYSDNTLAVVAFKRNDTQGNLWNFLGKYHSHYKTIRSILFDSPSADIGTIRLFSLGEDQDLVEYDIEHSGPYPDPGLKILSVNRIEYTAIPLCLAWYPYSTTETFLVIANSEYKYRLLNDTTKLVRGTFLCPTFDTPIQSFEAVFKNSTESNHHMIFVTDKEIGLQLLPLDGNPYKSIGMIGHPRKIKKIAIDCDGAVLFTSGCNDPCVLMWKINLRSVEVMARLGGEGLTPYYTLIEGGSKGWLVSEMKDLFYYAQILHQGENTTATRIVSDKVTTKQIPNLMRAIGYFPNNEEVENIMTEVSYQSYARTGQLIEEITFEVFVKLYINHRPAFGLSLRELQEAFGTFALQDEEQPMLTENLMLSRKQFIHILFGQNIRIDGNETGLVYGEPLTFEEAILYLNLLVPSENLDDHSQEDESKSKLGDFHFLKKGISYKEFITNIMGIELPKEMRADSE